jgi:hypothetical protein
MFASTPSLLVEMVNLPKFFPRLALNCDPSDLTSSWDYRSEPPHLAFPLTLRQGLGAHYLTGDMIQESQVLGRGVR